MIRPSEICYNYIIEVSQREDVKVEKKYTKYYLHFKALDLNITL